MVANFIVEPISLLGTNYIKIECYSKSQGPIVQVEERYNFIFHFSISQKQANQKDTTLAELHF